VKFLLQNRAILRNALRTSLPLVSSKKHAAQRPEKLRKKPSLNYKSAALPAELCRRKKSYKVKTESGENHCNLVANARSA
jgi:hypothetical protein